MKATVHFGDSWRSAHNTREINPVALPRIGETISLVSDEGDYGYKVLDVRHFIPVEGAPPDMKASVSIWRTIEFWNTAEPRQIRGR